MRRQQIRKKPARRESCKTEPSEADAGFIRAGRSLSVEMTALIRKIDSVLEEERRRRD